MGDKETRKRKKRRESAKKEETDDSSPARESSLDNSSKKKIEDNNSSHSLNEPSILAKLVFCILFMLLISAVGLIFYALNEATSQSNESFEVGDELQKSAVLPIIDDINLGESRNTEEEDEDDHDDFDLEPTIDEIINSIEESITYNSNDQDSNYQEANLDTIKTEEDESEDLNPHEEEIKDSEDQESVFTPNTEDSYVTDDENLDLPIPASSEPPMDEFLDSYEEELEFNTNPPVVETSPNPSVVETLPNPTESLYNDQSPDHLEVENEVLSDFSEKEPNSAGPEIIPELPKEPDMQQVPEETRSDIEDNLEKSDEYFDDIAESAPVVSESEEPQPDAKSYENGDITNEFDFLFREDLDEADQLVEKEPENGDFYFWNF